MIQMKQNDKIKRLKYIRTLEKFVKRTIALLKKDYFDFELFKKQTLQNYKPVELVCSVRLDSQYMQKLKQYIQLTLNSIENHSKTFEDEKQLLLKEANLLHKEKNKNNYKKDKHKKKSFTDGY